MSTKKIILYIILPAFFIIMLGIIYILNLNKKMSNNISTTQKTSGIEQYTGPSGQNYSSFEPSVDNKPISEDKIKLKTASGIIIVNNFRKNAQVIENGVEFFVDKEKYNISYDPEYPGFIVTILVNQDIETVRKEAERDFINTLGISQEDACKLNVFLYVSAALTTNEELYQNHGLSFCPGAKKFN